LRQLAHGLAAVAPRLEPKEGALSISAQAAVVLTEAMKAEKLSSELLRQWAQGLAAVAACLESMESASACAQAAATLVQVRSNETGSIVWRPPLAEAFSGILRREDTARRVQRLRAVTGTAGLLAHPGSQLLAPAVVASALKLPPPPLPAQTLVELLKHPLCVGDARRFVLDQLQRHYGRPFADQWDFVRFVTEQKLDLDLTSPPQRPETVAAGR
jgi:hypothetical protein